MQIMQQADNFACITFIIFIVGVVFILTFVASSEEVEDDDDG